MQKLISIMIDKFIEVNIDWGEEVQETIYRALDLTEGARNELYAINNYFVNNFQINQPDNPLRKEAMDIAKILEDVLAKLNRKILPMIKDFKRGIRN